MYLVHRTTTVATGVWTERRFLAQGPFDQPISGTYDTATPAGVSSSSLLTTTVARDFNHTPIGVFDTATLNAVALHVSGGAGAATELCSGYRGSWSVTSGGVKTDVTVAIELIDRGGMACCGTPGSDSGGSTSVLTHGPNVGGGFTPE